MEYASNITGEIYNDQFIKHVGYKEHICSQQCGSLLCPRQFYSKENIKIISEKITQLLMGVNKDNRPIIVPDKTIYSVMSSVYENFRPETGDIFTRYIVPKSRSIGYIQNMTDKVINIIVTNVRVTLETEENNSKLTVWTTVLGDFNEHGLRSHSKIKLREKRPQPLMFNMNY
jgi:hypothetical protein